MVSYSDVVDTIVELFREAETSLGDDVVKALREAYDREEGIAKNILEAILKNVELAREKGIPMCQDTGLPVIFAEVGRETKLNFNLREAITEGVVRATEEVPLRPNAVHPLTRKNSGDNTGMHMPLIYFDIIEGSELRLTVMPKGAGSENASKIKIMLPGDADKIPLFVAEVVKEAGGKPCPPVIVGVGIGSTFDGAAKLAKKALLRDITKMSEYELEILETVNSLGIGPMGLGGKTTALAVLVEMGHCHTASLPVAVNIQCWANRHATATLG